MMQQRRLRQNLLLGFCTLGLSLCLGGLRSAAADPLLLAGPLDVYTARVDKAHLQLLGGGANDVLGVRQLGADEYDVDLTLTPDLHAEFAAKGIHARLWTSETGQTYAQLLQAERRGTMRADGLDQDLDVYRVYRPFDGPGGIREELIQLAADHPGHVELQVIGTSVEDRDIIALRVTKDVAATAVGERPMVLFNSLQHAREWIAIETNRRLAHHFIEGYGSDPFVTDLINTQEIWFIVVANPDGYQLTFRTVEQGGVNWRLWRKNARDNDGDGAITNADGVDMNRNFDARWNYDIEGSSGNPQSATYRGPGPASEPEVAALQNFLVEMPVEIMLNYHSAAELILYPEGWQDQTRVADDPIYVALAGNFFNPAIPGFEPGLSAGLYITNGETCDFADIRADVMCYTPELSTPPGPASSGFHFPDDEALIEAEFQRNLPFALDVARSAGRLTEPVSQLGNTVERIYVEDFPVSHGDPQPVQANLQRKLGEATMHFRINAGPEQRVPTVEWDGGERYGDSGDIHYHRVRGQVAGAQAGDEVQVWFEAGGYRSDDFRYSIESDTGARVLLLANEDYTGSSPDYADTDGPSYLAAHMSALDALDVAYDIYDVDANFREAPSPLGILSHYDLLLWYTGDDVFTRLPDMPDGTVSRLLRDMMLSVRGFLNEGGKLFLNGKHVGQQFFAAPEYDPIADDFCDPNSGADGCEDISNDFFQYYLGIWNLEGISGLNGGKLRADEGPLAGLPALSIDSGYADHRDHGMLFEATSSEAVMPVDQYPQFRSFPGGSIEGLGIKPHAGDHYLYSGETFYEWQRVYRSLDLSSVGQARLDFWVNRVTRQPFDALIVEAHTVGEEDWTTLPDIHGHTRQTDALSCGSSQWYALFPHLVHYQSLVDGVCQPQGSSGQWHAATGASAGWENWSVDLSAWAGKEVEVSITYLSSRLAFQGVFVDDVSIHLDGIEAMKTSFETDLGGWEVGGLPVNGEPHEVDFSRITAAALPAPTGSSVMLTEDAVTFGFGFEAIAEPESRVEVLQRVLDYLLPDWREPRIEPPAPTPTIYLPYLQLR